MPQAARRVLALIIDTPEGLKVKITQEEGRMPMCQAIPGFGRRFSADEKLRICARESRAHPDLFLEAAMNPQIRAIAPPPQPRPAVRRGAQMNNEGRFGPAEPMMEEPFEENEVDRLERLQRDAEFREDVLRDEILHELLQAKRGLKMEDVMPKKGKREVIEPFFGPKAEKVVKKAPAKKVVKKSKDDKEGYEFRGHMFPRALTCSEMSYVDNYGVEKLLRVCPDLVMNQKEDEINEDEELIVNFTELADHYAVEECKANNAEFQIDTHEAEYQAAYKKHLKTILKFKKIKNG